MDFISTLMMSPWTARTMLRMLGMRVVDKNEGNWPDKYIVPVAPHTHNRDFPYGIYARAVVKQNIGFVAKASLFKPPVGAILKSMGGVPVERSKSTNFVQSVAQIFKERDSFKLCVAIEGTRKKVKTFKTGFYFIALEAKVPLILCKFDFGNHEIVFEKPFWPTGDIRADFDYIYRYYDGVQGLEPKNSFEYDPAVLDFLPEIRTSK